MQVHAERFATRFAKLFDQEGLMNVKFFVMNNDVSLPEFLDEAVGIQDTIAAGDFELVGSIDGHFAQKRFDAAF